MEKDAVEDPPQPSQPVHPPVADQQVKQDTPNRTSGKARRQILQWGTLLLAGSILAGVLYYNHQGILKRNAMMVPPKTKAVQRVEVEVTEVSPGSYRSLVSGYGSAEPRDSLSLTSQVAGRVVRLAPECETGKLIAEKSPLAWLEDTEYREAVTAARQQLAEAKLALLEEEQEAAQARLDWQLAHSTNQTDQADSANPINATAAEIKSEQPSALVQHIPQLEAAQATIRNAEAALATAEYKLKQTVLRAPFDALVVSRAISPGSYLAAGGEVANLYSSDSLEISVNLSNRQWSSLPDNATLTSGNWPATLYDVDETSSLTKTWHGTVNRVDLHLNTTSRQRSLTVTVDAPLRQAQPLLAGTFVRVEIEGTNIDGLWELPASALSQRGEVWYIDAKSNLANFAAQPLFSRNDRIYIRPPEKLTHSTTQVIVQPLSSYLTGMAVQTAQQRGRNE